MDNCRSGRVSGVARLSASRGRP